MCWSRSGATVVAHWPQHRLLSAARAALHAVVATRPVGYAPYQAAITVTRSSCVPRSTLAASRWVVAARRQVVSQAQLHRPGERVGGGLLPSHSSLGNQSHALQLAWSSLCPTRPSRAGGQWKHDEKEPLLGGRGRRWEWVAGWARAHGYR